MSGVLRVAAAVVVALASLSAAGYAPRPVVAADELPDLRVELAGLPLTGAQRELQIKITNISTWWSDEARLRVTANPPTAGSELDQTVENLDPGQSVTVRYTLASACAGSEVKVRAEVSAGKNYAGVPESGPLLANNVAEGVVCPGAGAPLPGGPFQTGPIRGPIEADPMAETALRGGPIVAESNEAETRRIPVPVAAELTPSAVRSGRDVKDIGGESCERGAFGALRVGWWQKEDECAWATQTAVKFDLSDLTRVPNTTIDSAVLSFNEIKDIWNDENGHPRYVNSCVTTLAYAMADWASQSNLNVLFPNEPFASKVPFGDREWLVTEQVNEWVTGARRSYGFVLRGQFEELEATDSTSCMSFVSDIKLTVTYTRPASTP